MDSRLAKCLSCNNLMPLLLQINGDLPDAPHQERMLYLFGCKAKECRKKPGSIRAIRGAKPTGISRKQPNGDKVAREESVNPSNQPTKVNMGDMIFGSSASSGGNPTNPFSSSNVNPFASSANTNPFASSSQNPFSSTSSEPKETDKAVEKLTKTFASVASISLPSTSLLPTVSSTKPIAPQRQTLIGSASPWPANSAIPQYASHLLDVEYEALEPDDITLQAQKLAKTIKMDTGGDDDMDLDAPNSSKKASATAQAKSTKLNSKLEAFESSMDGTFIHFQRIVNDNAEQLLRYEWKGTPLLYSRDDTIGKLLSGGKGGSDVSLAKVPKCGNCGKGRVYEFQLMPYAITVLEKEEKQGALDEGMVWGTVIVGTCSDNCDVPGGESGVGYNEEWVGVQWETD